MTDDDVTRTVDGLAAGCIVERIWARDHTVWKPEPAEISNRLGWLDAPSAMEPEIASLQAFAEGIRSAGIRRVYLLGMGGSSLAPEMYAKVYGAAPGFPALTVVDTTDPTAIASATAELNPETSLILVATKSGTTTETLSLFRFFYTRLARALGDGSGERFVAITDPGSPLVGIAKQHGFRRTFLNDPNLGGRYSALSHFGLVPASLLGVDVGRLLRCAARGRSRCGPDIPPAENPGAVLGSRLGFHARRGRNKLTFLLPREIRAFGDWVEQLVAESTGKEGTGIVPVVTEPAGRPDVYGSDRLFVGMQLAGRTADARIDALEQRGHPVVRLTLDDRHDLGEQIFLWAFAVAVAGHLLGINPFDQPDVEASKRLARQMVDAFAARGARPERPSAGDGVAAVQRLLAGRSSGDYVAVHAYLPPSRPLEDALRRLSGWIRDETGCATTYGYGPRFLHSTGQLHKGDGGHGRFLQLTCRAERDLAIPEAPGAESGSLTFGILKDAQALGDAQALRQAGRTVERIDLGREPEMALRALLDKLGASR
jgi:glucose-6-phosphate isomerase